LITDSIIEMSKVIDNIFR